MDKQKKIEILKSVGYTRQEIEKTMKMGTDIFTVQDGLGVLQEIGITASLDEIKAEKVMDVDFVHYDENENYIIINVY